MLDIGLAHYLSVAAVLFTLGIFGIFRMISSARSSPCSC